MNTPVGRSFLAACAALAITSLTSCTTLAPPAVMPPVALVPPVAEAAQKMTIYDYLHLLMNAHLVNCSALSIIRGEPTTQCLIEPME